jgi:hypothetical protein
MHGSTRGESSARRSVKRGREEVLYEVQIHFPDGCN